MKLDSGLLVKFSGLPVKLQSVWLTVKGKLNAWVFDLATRLLLSGPMSDCWIRTLVVDGVTGFVFVRDLNVKVDSMVIRLVLSITCAIMAVTVCDTTFAQLRVVAHNTLAKPVTVAPTGEAVPIRLR